MSENNRGIGSEGLEQGGPDLGNNYTRNDLSVGNAGDALTTPRSMAAKINDKDDADDIERKDEDLSDDILADDELGEDDELPEDDELGDDDQEEDKNR